MRRWAVGRPTSRFLASVAKDHSTHPIAQAFDFVRIGGAPEAFGEVEKLLLFTLLSLFGYRGILPSLHNQWYTYYRRYKGRHASSRRS